MHQLFEVLWRRKLTFLVVAACVVAAGFAALQFVTPIYESTSTVALSPKDDTDPTVVFSFFGNVDVLVPVYADAASSRSTRDAASDRMGGERASLSVETFRATPILRIKARDDDADVAAQYAQAVTDVLVERVENGEVGLANLDLKQVDPPVAATEPVFPRTRLTLAVTALLALGFGIGAALLRENLTTKVETTEDLARISGAPCYGSIPNTAALARVSHPEHFALDPQLRVAAEALRDLRTNLLFSAGSLNSLVITSPTGSHGKTTVSVGLASTLARAGTRTLLVDGDLRKGRIAEMLGMPRSPGLLDVLTGTNPNRAIQRTSFEALDIMPGGNLVRDPGELLAAAFATVLAALEEAYEVVLIDSTPLVPVNDARIMSRHAKGTVIVVSSGTSRRQVRSAVERLTLIDVRPTAVVLNRARRARDTDYGYLQPPAEAIPPVRSTGATPL